MGLSSKNINQRFFGSDIRPAVKQKLAYRQQFSKTSDIVEAVGSVKDMYGPIVLDEYTREFGGTYDNPADMSSRTPFVRMWTAVQLQKVLNKLQERGADFDDIHTELTELAEQGISYGRKTRLL